MESGAWPGNTAKAVSQENAESIHERYQQVNKRGFPE
jgi:hypothetical protein